MISPSDAIIALETERDALRTALLDLHEQYTRVAADHDALYDALEDAGVVVLTSNDGQTWTVVVRGFA